MIQLKNVSKFYYSKGMITSGFTKVNLDLSVGEFVVITGESGSGKSTLLNVISGLDSYEEGEMYVEGQETSHYTAAEFEEYRKKYIGNIFQSFNLVNSYTVYQNVELILLINGYSKEEIRRRVPDILEKVGLSEFARTKVSRLSGGQKQRVSIARALAKDTSILVADEPTGNLDSQSAEGIVKLLAEIARDKLVVVVTHNFEQFRPYATRVIRMNDGRISDDQVLVPATEDVRLQESYSDKMRVASKIRLGVRNTFNIVAKFVLLLIVFAFVTFSVAAIYTNFKEVRTQNEMAGWNDFFSNYTDTRIVIKKEDGSPISDKDLKAIQGIRHVKSIEKDDVVLDTSVDIEKGEFYFYGFPQSLSSMEGALSLGEMPKATNEAVVSCYQYELYDPDSLLGEKCKMYLADGSTITVVITGAIFLDEDEEDMEEDETQAIYLSEDKLAELRNAAYMNVSEVEILINEKAAKYTSGDTMYKVVANENVPSGRALVDEDLNSFYESGSIKGKDMKITVKNMYYEEAISLNVMDTYGTKTYQSKVGTQEKYDNHIGEIYINPEDYDSLFTHGIYQSSVFADDNHHVDEVASALKEAGFKPLALKNALSSFFGDEGEGTIREIVQIPIYILLVIAIFFIAYFVIRLILKSRDEYFSILRMLGLPRGGAKRILDIELFTVINLVYLAFLAVTILARQEVIRVQYLQNLAGYLQVSDYIILYVILVVMAFLISSRFARKLFAKSAMTAYRGEA